MKRAVFDDLVSARAAGRPSVLVTHLETGAQALILADRSEGDLALDADTIAAARKATMTERGVTVDTPAGRVFVHPFCPPARLIIVGAVHIAEPLVRIGMLASYGVSLIDPRRAFASRQPFSNLSVIDDWPDEALERLAPDQRTAVVTLAHDPKIDDAALGVALRSPAFYIGSLGSRKTHAARLHRLRKLGFSDDNLARIHGPVGLDIGALSPSEIAVSIIAEITRTRRRADDR